VKKKEEKKRNTTHITMMNNYNTNPYTVNLEDSVSLIFEQNYFIDFNKKWELTLKREYDNKENKIVFQQMEQRYQGLKNIKLVPFESMQIETNKFYLLELKSEKGETFYARIIFKSKN